MNTYTRAYLSYDLHGIYIHITYCRRPSIFHFLRRWSTSVVDAGFNLNTSASNTHYLTFMQTCPINSKPNLTSQFYLNAV